MLLKTLAGLTPPIATTWVEGSDVFVMQHIEGNPGVQRRAVALSLQCALPGGTSTPESAPLHAGTCMMLWCRSAVVHAEGPLQGLATERLAKAICNATAILRGAKARLS
jgi:hypothetical protein